jgi:MFS family permease
MTRTVAGGADQRPGQRALLALLVVSICINYIDRGNLSIAAAAPGFRSDLALSSEALGVLFSMFFVTYASFQIVAGWTIDRYGVVPVFTIGYVLWSAATIFTGLAGGFAGLLAWRLVLGVGEAVAYPAYSKFLAAGFPEERRGLANALIDAGSRMGPAVGIVIGGQIAARYGWRMVFFVIGGAGLVWLVPWLWHMRGSLGVQRRAVAAAGGGPNLRRILSRREAWGTFLGLFCLNYSWYFVLTWLPTYLRDERHYSMRMISIYGSLPFWAVAATSVAFGALSDRLIRRGRTPTRVRLACLGGGLSLSALMIPAYLIQDQVASMALMVVACLSLGVASSNLWAVTQTLAGPAAAARWTGLQNAMGNIAGVLSPYVAGLIVGRTGSFFLVFVVASAVAVTGALSYWFIVRRVERVDWTAA